ncbi:MAG: glycosyltransferase family 4 protein [Fibrobacteres bacterium]|jgi:phosphatidylinositol alpha-1,6-mannosyltransferase|nr:glycosyltransferase family 4 protein [Fibrobacterota bacterium]
MDILIVSQDFPPEEGGIQTYVLELARRFIARGHDVRVICPGLPDAPAPLPGLKEVVRLRIGSSFLWSRLLTYLPGYLRSRPSLSRILYAQWQGAAGAFLCPKGVRKEYALVHGRELLTSVFGPLQPGLMRKAFARLDGAFPNSNEVLRLTRAHARPGCPLHLIHPGVDPQAFRPVDAAFLRARYGLGDAPVIVSLGRMVARKNLRMLIESLPAVRRAWPGTRLLLGGTGPERESLMARAGELELATGPEAAVLFPGRIADGEMAAHYSLADVFCLPSLASPKDVEGFGIVYLEAGACEVPVVGGRAGGVPDAVADGETGLLIDPASRGELEGALIALLSDRERRRAMGRRARERILKDFTWDACADRMLACMA